MLLVLYPLISEFGELVRHPVRGNMSPTLISSWTTPHQAANQERESLRAENNSDISAMLEMEDNNGDDGALDEDIQDFEVDELFHLSPLTCPNMRDPEAVASAVGAAHSDIQGTALKLKIFTGSWNMAATDPFVDKKDQYIGDDMAAASLTEFLPLGYDLYVVATQEKVSKHLHTAVLVRLNTGKPDQELDCAIPSSATQYVRLGLDIRAPPKSAPASPSSISSRASNNSELNDSFLDSVLRASSFGIASSSFSIGRSTEAGSPSSSPIVPGKTTENGMSSEQKKKRSAHEVRGRGDGAFLHSKSTSIAIYIAAHLQSAIEVVRIGAHKFSLTSGSKGGLGVMLRFAGDQTITFVNCHLEANRPALRRQQLDILTRKLPKAMGFDDSKFDLATCSDHVVWLGDFNYRIHSLDGETVLKLLGTDRHMELHDRYDSMKDDVDLVPGLRPFTEPSKWPSFYPTYKKLPHRSRVSTDDPSWPTQVYRVLYKEPFYKGGKVKARVPGWCDRILHCSSPAWRTCFEVEKLPCRLGHGASDHSSAAVDANLLSFRDNYRSVNDGLRGSDHSPVYCTFLWSVNHPNQAW